ncbi:MAG: hypothetical protein SX243_19505 [Acidobacteriota bacterium]|nr:hypothetical protein [Acidobacteriota bacterium]
MQHFRSIPTLLVAFILALTLTVSATAEAPATTAPEAQPAAEAQTVTPTPNTGCGATGTLASVLGSSAIDLAIVDEFSGIGPRPYNPCYTFDDPTTGCYYTWSPQTYCCLGNYYWCHDICW